MPFMSGKKWLILIVVLVLAWYMTGGRMLEGMNCPAGQHKDATGKCVAGPKPDHK